MHSVFPKRLIHFYYQLNVQKQTILLGHIVCMVVVLLNHFYPVKKLLTANYDFIKMNNFDILKFRNDNISRSNGCSDSGRYQESMKIKPMALNIHSDTLQSYQCYPGPVVHREAAKIVLPLKAGPLRKKTWGGKALTS